MLQLFERIFLSGGSQGSVINPIPFNAVINVVDEGSLIKFVNNVRLR